MIQNLQYKQWIIRPPRMQKQKNDYDEFNMKSEYSKFSYPTSHIALHKASPLGNNTTYLHTTISKFEASMCFCGCDLFVIFNFKTIAASAGNDHIMD
uniref:Ovule protein n=1 Tax=Parascaris univalens TaxID=6257 RepID=A0A915BQK4_PARUN